MAENNIKFAEISNLSFELTIQNLTSVLAKNGDSVECPPRLYCDTFWRVKVLREVNFIRYDFKKDVDCRTKYKEVFVRSSIQINDGDIKFHLPGSVLRVNDIKESSYTKLALSWIQLGQRDSLKIIFSVVCSECKNNGGKCSQTLKLTHPENDDKEVSSRKERFHSSDDHTLQEDMKKMFTTGEDSDMIIKVKNREFRAHKNIIRVRSPALFSMFNHNMDERNDSTIHIPDCDPEAFQQFLTYLYCGELNNVPKHITFSLFKIGHKYGIEEIKEICAVFMEEQISIETFCDVVTFSLEYKRSELLDKASNFFVRNMRKITETAQWELFLKTYPKEGSDLHILTTYHSVMRTN